MIAHGLPAIAGGQPIRTQPLPYGRHEITGADRDAVLSALDAEVLTGGQHLANFEAALAAAGQVGHAVAVSSGTAALHLALAAIGVHAGSEVITTPLTFAATANAALFLGATPVFADIGPDRCLAPAAVAALVTERTAAVVVVDYGGLPADVDAVRGAVSRSIPVVADAAHSLGGRSGQRPVGSLADITTLSFHPVKHITTGEGGACLTADDELAARMRRLRNHAMSSTATERRGRNWRYDIDELGWNYRLSDVMAALGASQLRRLPANVERRTALARRYDELLMDVPGLVLPPRVPQRLSAWHLYAVEIDAERFGMERDDVVDGLRAEAIEATVHYPAVHLLGLYRRLGYGPGQAPRAESVCARVLSLPLHPAMRDEDQDQVAEALRRLRSWAVSSK